MFKKKEITALILACSMVFGTCSGIAAEDTESSGLTDEAVQYENVEQSIKERYEELNGTTASEVSDEAAAEYSQEIIDDINNNPVDGGISEENTSADETAAEADYSIQQEEVYQINSTSETSLSSTDSAVPEEFKTEPINAQYNVYNNNNESVSLATGALNFEKTLLSFSGRNGLDLNISIRYNSDDAVITENEYDSYSNIRSSSFNHFAIGWNFGFSAIIKNKEKYGYNKDTSLMFSDGSMYKIQGDSQTITEDKTLTLENYRLSDISLIRKADTGEYILTYSDGTKEYFDGTYGSITKREDRFGNSIVFEYEDIDYFRGSFIDYIFNPNFYSTTLHVLSEITDSTGRVIDIEYNVDRTNSGKNVSKIQFKIDDTVYAALNLDRVKSYNGEINILKSIVDAEGLCTKFEYDEKLAHIYYSGYEGDIPSYTVSGSTFAMTKIIYPSDGFVEYTYTKERRSYCYYIPDIIQTDWYEVYKVSERYTSDNDITQYKYEGDRSGYPYSNLCTDVYSDPTGYIYDEDVKYHTIVRHNGTTTIHTFDYKHNKISEQTYNHLSDISPVNMYVRDNGEAAWNVVVNNKIYRVGISEKTLYIYTQARTITDTQNSSSFLKPYTLNEEITISNVKTQGSNIYIFYRTGLGNSYSLYKYCAVMYNVSTDEWSEAGEYTMPYQSVSMNLLNMKNMYYADGIFYAYYSNGSNIYYITYDTSKDVNSRWEYKNVSCSASGTLYHLCSKGTKIYYKHGRYLIEYDLLNNTYTEKLFSSLDSNAAKGFSIYGKTYLYSSDYLYEFDYSAGELVNSYTYPFETGYYDRMQKGTDGNMYYFCGTNSTDGLQYIYRFNPNNETPWELVTYRLFDNMSFNVIMGDDIAYITLSKDSGQAVSGTSQLYDTAGKNYGGFEKVNLSGSASIKERSRIDNAYNDYNQLVSVKKTVFSNHEKKVVGEEQWEYVPQKTAVSSYTDVLDNKTSYEYTDSTYYIPTKITKYSGTDNALVTLAELSEDKKKVLNTVTEYDDRSVKTDYTYSSAYPGNITSEQSSEIKDGQSNILNKKEYTYDSNGVFVSQEKIKDVVTNGTDFNAGAAADIINSYTYNDMGLLASETNAKGQTVQYTYNNNGWLTQTDNPDGTFVKQIYSINDNEYKITTSYNDQYYVDDYYNVAGKLYYRADRGTSTSEKMLMQCVYVGDQLYMAMDANYNLTMYDYDIYGRITKIDNVDPGEMESLAYQSVDYDDFNLKKTVSNGGSTKTLYYDKGGRLIKEEQNTDAGVNTITYDYDYMGNVVRITDANGESITKIYNDMGQLINTTDMLNQTTAYEYDLRGNLSRVIYSSGAENINEYDNLGRLQKSTDALGLSEYFAYDNLGNVTAYKDKKNQITSYTYDNMSRLLNKQSENMQVSYTYDSMGNVLTMNDSTGTTSYTYLYNSLLSGITAPDNKSISYSYDKQGNITGVNDYAGNTYVYKYDRLNRLKTITKNNSEAASYNYTMSGAISSITYPEGTVQYTYDNALRIMSQTNTLSDGMVLRQYNYTYDIVGNQIRKEDISDDVDITNYTYDSANRLTSVTEPDSTVTSYTFDSASNITTKNITHPQNFEYSFTQNGTDYTISNLSTHNFTYSYNEANQLMQEKEFIAGNGDEYSGYLEIVNNYTYDANGNTLKCETSGQADDSTIQYSYNEWNQLTEYRDNNNNATNYTYDGAGVRVAKTQDGVTQKYYWDRNYIINEACDGVFTASNCIGPQGIFARESENVTNYLFKNGHGDVTELVSSGAVVKSYDYDAYGKEKDINPEDTNPFRYCGEYYDSESENIYLCNRYYNSDLSRFITEDPAKKGTNWYVYCADNPIIYIDPTGLDVYYYTNTEFRDEAYRDKRELEKIYNEPVHVLEVSTSDEFIDEWEMMGSWAGEDVTVSLVVINMHGDPDAIYLRSDDTDTVYARNLIPKYIGDIIILGCNTGHLDYRYSNFANEMLVQNIVNSVIASDGDVSGGSYGIINRKTRYKSTTEGHFYNYTWEEKHYRENEGFIQYTKNWRGELEWRALGKAFNGLGEMLRAAGIRQ